MMRRGAALLILSLAMALPASAQEGNGMTPAIAECLQKNAAAVETAEPDLTKATEYLVSSACALPVAAEQKRLADLRLQTLQQRNRQRCEDRVAQQKKNDLANNPRSTRTYEDCTAMSDMLADSTRYSLLSLSGMGPKPAAALSMAAKLILDLRVAHNKPRP